MGSQHSAAAETDRWLTPRFVLDALGAFDLDPCGAPGWDTAAEVWTPEEVGDGLSMPWHGRVWMNPPYGLAMTAWLRALAIHDRGTALVFARTETAAFHDYVWPYASAMLFLRGRLTFLRPNLSDGEGNAGAPSVLIAYGSEDAEILRACPLAGAFVDLTARAAIA
jgi:hypothetical protein